MSTTLRIGILLGALAAASACAPTDRTTDPTPSETEFHAGSLSGATLGRVGPAQTTNSGSVTLTGLVGNFTRLTVDAPSGGPGSALVYFAASDTSGTARIWRAGTSGGPVRQLTDGPFGQSLPSVSHAGDQVMYVNFGPFVDRETDITDLWIWDPKDGSHFLANERNLLANPAWLPADTAVVYPSFFHTGETNRGLYRRSVTTGQVDSLTHAPDGPAAATTVNGVPTIVFERGAVLLQMDLTTLAISSYLDSATVFGPQITADGRQILYWRSEADGRVTLHQAPFDNPKSEHTITALGPGIDFLPDARWLPDGSGVVLLEHDSTVNPPVAQLYLMDTLGVRIRQLSFMPFGVRSNFSVGPALANDPRSIIGDDGVLGSSASGIIFGQGAGGTITALVVFGSARPRTITLKAETGLNANAPVLTYTLTAEQLNSLRFISGPIDGLPVTVIDSTTPAAGGAVITFHAQTGAVALILPFATSNVLPSFVDRGGVRMFRGDFLGAWKDGEECRVAPGGAGNVELDVRSGALQIR